MKTPTRKHSPILDEEGNEVPKVMPKARGQNFVADMLTRFRSFIIWANDNGYATNNPFKKFTIYFLKSKIFCALRIFVSF